MFKKISSSKDHQFLGFLFIVLGLYVFLFQIRWQIIFSISGTQRFYLWAINVFALLGLFLLVSTNYKTFQKSEWFVISCLLISCIPLAVSKYLYGVSFGTFIVYLTCCIFPIVLILLDIDFDILKKGLKILFIIINVLFIIITIGALIDKLCDRAMIKWLSTFMIANEAFTRFAFTDVGEASRYFSIFGHPLLTAFVSNTFLVLNIIGRKYKVPYALPNLFSFLFAFIITAVAASKTSIVVILVIALITFHNNYKALLVVIVGLLFITFTGLFNELIYRLISGSLTSGRIPFLLKLFSDSRYPFHFFYGYGDISITNDAFFAAFEFPIILSAFEYGILFMILFIVVPFIYVTWKFIGLKKYSLYFYWLILFAQINTYPTLAQGYDHPWFFYFVTFIMLQYAKNVDN